MAQKVFAVGSMLTLAAFLAVNEPLIVSAIYELDLTTTAPVAKNLL